MESGDCVPTGQKKYSYGSCEPATNAKSTSFNDNTSVRDFLYLVAADLGKSPQSVEPYIHKCEDNWNTNVKSLKSMSQKEWNELNLPTGL